MTVDLLIDAIGQIDDKYILGAKDIEISKVTGDPKQNGHDIRYRRRILGRKVYICIAATIVFILASFATAMAVSVEFREAVFSIFHIGTTEVIPSTEVNSNMNSTIEHISDSNIDGEVSVYYFKINGIIQANNGIVYSSQYNETDAAFFNVTAKGLEEITATRVEFAYSFKGTDFNIKYDYTIYNDNLYFRVLPESLDVNPYKYGWSMYKAGNSTDKVWLILPYSVKEDYSSYPLLLNIKTNEITDVFEGVDVENIVIDKWQFTDDMAYALISGYSDDHTKGFWICDILQKTITPVSELTGRTINDCYILEDEMIVCYAANGDNFDVINYDIHTGAETTVVENVQHYGLTDDGSGFSPIEYNGGQGQHALLFDSDGNVTLLDLVTGNQLPLTGLKNDGTLITSESPDGKHIMIAFRDSDYSGSLAMHEIGVLDTQTGVLTMMDRENYEAKTENVVGWLDNDRIAVIAHDDTDECYLYVYYFD